MSKKLVSSQQKTNDVVKNNGNTRWLLSKQLDFCIAAFTLFFSLNIILS